MTIPFVPARNYTPGRNAKIRLLVIHDMEAPESATTAESVARYFANQRYDPKGGSSTHYNIDVDSIVQSVRDSDTAWCAPKANANGLHFEHAGYARQTAAQWLDPYGRAMLELSAGLVAAKAKQYGIPVVKLTPAQVAAGRSGICGHWDVTRAYPGSGSHTDPGANFPWDYYIGRVKAHYGGVAAEGDWFDMATPAELEQVVRKVLADPAVLREVARYVVTGYPVGPDGDQQVLGGWAYLAAHAAKAALEAIAQESDSAQVKAAVEEALAGYSLTLSKNGAQS